MKKLWMLFIVAAFAACTKSDPNLTTVNLHLDNAEFEEVELVYVTDFIVGDRVIETVANDGNGTFAFEILPDAPLMASLTLGDQRLNIFLNHGKELTINADMLDLQNSIAFEGSLANENEFLKLYSIEVEPSYNRQAITSQMRTADPEEFLSFTNAMTDEIFLFMEDFHQTDSLSEAFRDYFITDISYQVYGHKLMFPRYQEYYKDEDDIKPLPEGYYDFVEPALFFTEENLRIPSCAGFLTNYMSYYLDKHNEQVPEGISYPEMLMWVAENGLEDTAQKYGMAYAINFQFNHGDFQTAVENFEDFKQDNTWQYLNNILAKSKENASKVAPGAVAPEFTLTDINGEEVSLSDFKGKVVYLDFWASWCGPCMREVPHAKELKKRFEDEDDLVFLYVSVDEDPNAWRRTVEEHQIQGVHLNVKGMRDDVAQSYNVRGVPSFFLIDREGIIHDNNPSRPSGDTIDEELKALLQDPEV
ncbi:MAG: TlpA family protein disulfide reductase [Bacteroidota bacterium]